MITVQVNIVPKWEIAGFPGYVFGENKKLYNVGGGKEIKPKLKQYTRGYNLNGKFKSQKQLRPLLKKYTESDCPF